MKERISIQLERIERLLQNHAIKPFTLREAAEYLHISPSYLYRLTGRALIGHYKPGGKKIIFNKEDLDRYLFRNRIKSTEELRQEAAEYQIGRVRKTKSIHQNKMG